MSGSLINLNTSILITENTSMIIVARYSIASGEYAEDRYSAAIREFVIYYQEICLFAYMMFNI